MLYMIACMFVALALLTTEARAQQPVPAAPAGGGVRGWGVMAWGRGAGAGE